MNRLLGYFEMTEKLSPFARKLRLLRGPRAQSVVAKDAGISVDTLRSWENGYVNTVSNEDALNKVAKYYGVTVPELFGDPEELPNEDEPATDFEKILLQKALHALRGKYRSMVTDAILLAEKHG